MNLKNCTLRLLEYGSVKLLLLIDGSNSQLQKREMVLQQKLKSGNKELRKIRNKTNSQVMMIRPRKSRVVKAQMNKMKIRLKKIKYQRLSKKLLDFYRALKMNLLHNSCSNSVPKQLKKHLKLMTQTILVKFQKLNSKLLSTSILYGS